MGAVSNASVSSSYRRAASTTPASSFSFLMAVQAISPRADALLHPQMETHIIAASKKIVNFRIVLPLYCPRERAQELIRLRARPLVCWFVSYVADFRTLKLPKNSSSAVVSGWTSAFFLGFMFTEPMVLAFGLSCIRNCVNGLGAH